LLLLAASAGAKRLRQRQRIAGRQDRKNEIGTGDFVIARGGQPRRGGARDGCGAALVQGRQHLEPMLDQTLPTEPPWRPARSRQPLD